MKFTCLALLSLAPGLRATPVDDALAAAQKLSTAPNYAWTAMIDENGHAAEVRGKTNDSRYSVVTYVGFAGGRVPANTKAAGTSTGSGTSGATGTSGTGTSGGADTRPTTNAVYLGNDRGVIETTQGWVVPTEPTATAATEDPEPSSNRTPSRSGSRSGAGGMRSGRMGGRTGVGMGGGGMGGGGMGGPRGGRSGDRIPTASAGTPSVATGPRVPAAINLPADELAIMATNHTDLRYENGILSGKLTSTGAELLFVAPGSTQIPPEGAAGSFKIWARDGVVSQYELKLTADTQPGGGRGPFAETVTVNLKDIGSTQFDVPAAAKKKLGI